MTKIQEHQELFKTKAPLIGCVHFMPLPGTPHYDPTVSMAEHVKRAKREAKALEEAGFDAIIFANEGDRPYLFEVGPEIIASYTRIATEVIQDVNIPYGCGVLMDAKAAISIANAIGAKFIRGYISGTYSDTYGFHQIRPADIYRFKKNIGADDVRLYSYFSAHGGVILDDRGIERVVEDALGVLEPAGILVTDKAGTTPDFEQVITLKKNHPNTPVLITSGINNSNVKQALEIGDGCVVGTNLKYDGIIWNEIDPERAKKFVETARG
ncbi:BtpA/SgcQ family protein [Anaeropeptidivorans aminofermentans]|jgi:hypothetical protein|uniref:BtpA/SgcQ family protein n=1 Tax=Anaeropeptidivorans aminofermentans TaxID=2934315 RepID=UPI0020248FFD|nr:BtpA/SgcQ family protein [Anaeropeptidivorans aminofermentans]MBE6012018.1 BtpA/SgcQ family protein [Lachnospiraceae bacterium]